VTGAMLVSIFIGAESFIGEVHRFIGEKKILLAKMIDNLAKNKIYWRTGNLGCFFPVGNG
jgi:hypothetical protein